MRKTIPFKKLSSVSDLFLTDLSDLNGPIQVSNNKINLLFCRKIFNDLSGSESPTKVETISEDIQGQSDGTEGASPIAVITTSTLNYQQAPQTVTIPGTIQIVTSGEALQAVPMAQNSSGAVVQYQQQQQVRLLLATLSFPVVIFTSTQ